MTAQEQVQLARDAKAQMWSNKWSNSALGFSSSQNNMPDDHLATFEEFYGKNPYSLDAKINNFFTGKVSSAKQAYDNYVTNYQNKWTAQREDTAIQRQMKDAAAAGLNPLALLTGSAPSGAASSASAEYRKTGSSKESQNSVITTALKLLALLAIKG